MSKINRVTNRIEHTAKSVADDVIKTTTKVINSVDIDSTANKIGHVATKVADGVTTTAKSAGKDISRSIKKAKEKSEKKKEMNFRSVDSLQQVVNVVNEAAAALHDDKRTMHESPIQETLAGALGAGVGGVGSFGLLYGLGSVGLSAAGITSGLATAGGIIGGGMVAGVFVLAAPVAALTGVGVLTATQLKSKQLTQEKDRLYKEALRKQEAILQEMKEENQHNKERLDYLQSLNILLNQAIKDLKSDIEIGATL